MAVGLILLAVPLAVFASLSFLPKGRPAFMGIGIAIVAAGALAVMQAGEPAVRALTLAVIGAAVLAALAQVLRLVLERGQAAAWTYPAVVAGLALSVMMIMNFLIGG